MILIMTQANVHEYRDTILYCDFGMFFVEMGFEQTMVTSDTSKYNDRALSISVGKPERFVITLRGEKRDRVPDWLIPKLGEETFAQALLADLKSLKEVR